jgi:hypothetical protein
MKTRGANMGSEERAMGRQAKALTNGHLTVFNADIYAAREPLQRLMALSLPVRSSFALARLASALQGPMGALELVRSQIINRHGDPVEGKPGTVKIASDSEGYAKFTEEMSELYGVEVTVEASKVILPASVGDSLEIEANVLAPLLKFVDIEAAPAKETS